MSTETDELRKLTNEPADASKMTDAELTAIVAAHTSMNAAAAHVWRIKAGTYADLVSMSEGNSSRQWSGAYKQALEMAALYEQRAEDEGSTAGRPTAIPRKIIRS